MKLLISLGGLQEAGPNHAKIVRYQGIQRVQVSIKNACFRSVRKGGVDKGSPSKAEGKTKGTITQDVSCILTGQINAT